MIANELYEKNLSCLEKRYPAIIEKLNNIESMEIEITVDDSKDSNKFMSIEKNGIELYVHSKYRPREEAKRWLQNLDIKDETVIFVFGFGLGYHIAETMKILGEGNHLIVFEPETAVFYEAVKNIDLTAIIMNKRVTLVLSDMDELKRILEDELTWLNVGMIEYGCLSNYERLFDNYYKEALEVVKKMLIVKAVGRNTVFAFAFDWQKNTFENLPSALRSSHVKQFSGLFNGKPAVIVAAGPSLSKNYKLLKEIKEKAVIISVGRALRILLKENIIPDMVVTVDGGDLSYEQFKGVNYYEIPLLYTPKAHPGILKDHTGPKILALIGDYYLDSLFNEMGYDVGYINAGGSVACSAFDMAVKMGCDPIIFIGQDLAYTNGMTHAKGAELTANPNDFRRREHIKVKDIYGNDIFTDDALYIFLNWFENAIAADKSDRIYIDATEGGAMIRGTKIMTFAEAIDQCCKDYIAVSEKFSGVFNIPPEISDEKIKRIIDEYKASLDEFGEIKKKCLEANKLSSKLFNIFKNNSTRKINAILKRLDEIDVNIKEKKEALVLVEYVLQPVIYNAINLLNEKENEDEQEMGLRAARKSELLYTGIKGAIENIEPILEQCIEELQKLVQNPGF